MMVLGGQRWQWSHCKKLAVSCLGGGAFCQIHCGGFHSAGSPPPFPPSPSEVSHWDWLTDSHFIFLFLSEISQGLQRASRNLLSWQLPKSFEIPSLKKLLIDICYRHWTKGIEQVLSQKKVNILKPFHTGFLNFLKSTQNEAELRKELNQTAEADNLGVKPITEVSQATANTMHK